MAQGVGAAEELLEGWWGLPALPVETPGVSRGGPWAWLIYASLLRCPHLWEQLLRARLR